MVGICILAPSTASQGEMGTSVWVSSPMTEKTACCRILNLTKRSREPLVPGPSSPGPDNLITDPSRAPGGIFASTDFGLVVRPDPRQALQVTALTLPRPP